VVWTKGSTTVLQFGAELKALSSREDKLDFANGLRSVGVGCADPAPLKAAA